MIVKRAAQISAGRRIRRLFQSVVMVAVTIPSTMPLTIDASAAAVSAAPACPTALTGRTLVLPRRLAGFGRVQGQPPLLLAAGEYAVTIDDGPNPVTTPALLRILRDHCVRATFFLIGRNATAHPDLVRQIVAEGHGIGSHSLTHPNFGTLAPDAIRAEIVDGAAAVARAAGRPAWRPGKPQMVRLPGATGLPPRPPAAWMELLRRNGLTLAGYDISPEDWRNDPPQISLKRLKARLGDRGVIVFHDGPPNTPRLLPMALDELEHRGATVVRLRLAGERAR